MKQLIKISLVVLVIVSSVFAQALTRYEQRATELQLNFMIETLESFPRSASTNNILIELRQIRGLPNNHNKMEVTTAKYIALIPVFLGMATQSGIGSSMAFNNRQERFVKDLEAAKNLMTPAERRAEREREERQRQAERAQAERQRREAEERRVRDSIAVEERREQQRIRDSIHAEEQRILREQADAWMANFPQNIQRLSSGNLTLTVGLPLPATSAASAPSGNRARESEIERREIERQARQQQIQQQAQRAGRTIETMVDFRSGQDGRGFAFVDNNRREIRFRQSRTSDWTAPIFQIEANATGTITRINRVGNLIPQMFGFIEASSELTSLEIERAELVKKQEWVNRMIGTRRPPFILRTQDNRMVRFAAGRPQDIPIPWGVSEVQGKQVRFVHYSKRESRQRFNSIGSDIVCYITDRHGIEHRVLQWTVYRGNMGSGFALTDTSALVRQGLGFLGFGIFDVAPENFPPLIAPTPQAQTTPSAAEIAQVQAAEQTRIVQEQAEIAQQQQIQEQQRLEAERLQRAQEQAAAEQQRIQAEQAQIAAAQATQAVLQPAPAPIVETTEEEMPQAVPTPTFVQETVVPQPAQPTPIATPSANNRDTGDRNNTFVLSVRPELVMGTAVANIGLNVEIGTILENGLYISGDLSGGAIYFGGMANLGYCINQNDKVKNVLGASAGFRNSIKPVDFEVDPFFTASANGINTSFGGIFHKLMIGGQSNLDITNRLMFGHRSNPVIFRVNDNQIFYEDGVNITWSLGIGYTLTRRK
ncbi:MAG: hypothetical protein FWE23_01370 [Chitinivibrionia bacterium]|nr:hypothetical protein [Chitinivibrionia bacterium]